MSPTQQNQTQHSPNPEIIRSMFSKVAGQYDKANSVLSVGIHHLWRKKLVRLSGATDGQSILDCATGTGDLAIEFKKAVGPNGRVVGTDFCADMLESAPQKAKAENLDILFEQADVTQLQYQDNQFDVVSISFGIRNVNNPVKALQEMARVAKPGGRVMILEFGQMQTPVVKDLYGDKIDIHGGGLDLMFPHHENEIAQSEACFDHDHDAGEAGKNQHQFVNYWMHWNMIQFSGAKMSKSLGNVIPMRDFLKIQHAEVYKWMMLTPHYRSTAEYSEDAINLAVAGLARVYSALALAESIIQGSVESKSDAKYAEE